jgi:hypothetical protein
MTQFGTWVSYSGDAKIDLAIVLAGAAGGLVYAGIRLKLPIQPARPGKPAIAVMLTAWGASILAFLICGSIYIQKVIQQYPGHSGPTDPILPVTLTAMVTTFIVIFRASPQDSGTRLLSALTGAIAAPMIFELPFDLIVMARVYPQVHPHPAVQGFLLFFLPLFLIEITTLWLLTTSPMVKLSRSALFSFAAMLAVFAVWSLAGFDYPSTAMPIALNVVSKLLAFVTVLSLFLPQRAKASAQDETQSAPAQDAAPLQDAAPAKAIAPA